MTREDVFELMQEDIDGQISEDRKAMLFAALKTDPELNRYYNAYQDIQEGMIELEVEPPEGLARGVMYRIRNGDKKPRRFSFGLGTLAAAAVLLVVLVGSGVLKQISFKQAPSTPESAGQMNSVSFSMPAEAVSEMESENPEHASFEAAPESGTPLAETEEQELATEMTVNHKSENVQSDNLEESMLEPASAPSDSCLNDSLLSDAERNDADMPSAEENIKEKEVSILRVHLHGEKASDVAPDEFLYPFDQGYWFESTLENAYAFEASLPEVCEAEFDLTEEADEASLILVWLIED